MANQGCREPHDELLAGAAQEREEGGETGRGGNSANGNVSPPGERVRLHDRVHVGWAQTYAGGSAEKEQISEEDGDNWGARWRTVVPQQMRKQWAQARKEQRSDQMVPYVTYEWISREFATSDRMDTSLLDLGFWIVLDTESTTDAIKGLAFSA